MRESNLIKEETPEQKAAPIGDGEDSTEMWKIPNTDDASENAQPFTLSDMAGSNGENDQTNIAKIDSSRQSDID